MAELPAPLVESLKTLDPEIAQRLTDALVPVAGELGPREEAVLERLVKGIADSPWAVLLAINIFLLVVGCVIDPASAILILTPLLVPICKAYGIDLIHFGVIMALNLAIGMFHPPFGLNIFVVQALTRAPVGAIYMGVIPFVVVALIALVIVTYVPWLSLYLTSLM